MDDVTFSHNAPCGMSFVFLGEGYITAEATASISSKFCSTIKTSTGGESAVYDWLGCSCDAGLIAFLRDCVTRQRSTYRGIAVTSVLSSPGSFVYNAGYHHRPALCIAQPTSIWQYRQFATGGRRLYDRPRRDYWIQCLATYSTVVVYDARP